MRASLKRFPLSSTDAPLPPLPSSSLPPAPSARRYDSLDSVTNGRSDIDSGSASSRRTSRQYSLDSRHSLSDRWVSVPPLQFLLLLLLLLRPVTLSRCDVSGGLVPSSLLAVLACMCSYPISINVYILYISTTGSASLLFVLLVRDPRFSNNQKECIILISSIVWSVVCLRREGVG